MLNYAQVQSIAEGETAEQLIDRFGEPGERLETDGEIRALGYAAENPYGEVQELRIGFGDDGKVVRWTLAPRNRSK